MKAVVGSAGVVALVLAAAACGGSSKKVAAGATSTSSAAASSTSTTASAASSSNGSTSTTSGGSSTASCTARPAGDVVVNGDAESGALAPDDASAVAPQGWTATGAFTAAAWDNTADLPHAADPGPADRGKGFFAGGPDNDTSSATQTDPLPAGAAGHRYTLAACLGGYAGQDDAIVVTAQFLDGGGAPVGTPASIGPVTGADRQSATGLLARSTSGTVPSGAASVKVTMTSTRASGSYDDGYADDVALSIATS
jgi:hypothetical protein